MNNQHLEERNKLDELEGHKRLEHDLSKLDAKGITEVAHNLLTAIHGLSRELDAQREIQEAPVPYNGTSIGFLTTKEEA